MRHGSEYRSQRKTCVASEPEKSSGPRRQDGGCAAKTDSECSVYHHHHHQNLRSGPRSTTPTFRNKNYSSVHQRESYPDEERSTSQSYRDCAVRSDRDNLKIYPNTLARRVLFSANLTATGVELEASVFGNSKLFHLNASKETIIAVGAFQSPQLLMVSGIGPRQQLELHGIKVLADRPSVGANMEDHLDLATTWEITIPSDGVTLLRKHDRAVP